MARAPTISLLVVGNQRGMLKPCGCSKPQRGGLERLAVLLERARRRAGRGFGALSLGWTASARAEEQTETKAALYRRALEVMGFDAMVLGTTDLFVPAMAQPYGGESELLRPAPPGNAPLSVTGPLAVAADTRVIVDLEIRGLKIRVLSLLDPAWLLRLSGVAILVQGPGGSLQRLEPRPDTLWIVSTDATGEAIEDVKRAMKRLGPTVIVDFGRGGGSDHVEDVRLDDGPQVVTMDDLGKEVGLLDLDRLPPREGGGWRIAWHAVGLTPALDRADTPLRREMASLFASYERRVRERGYLARFPTYADAERASYVGSGRCVSCHEAIYRDWLATPHARALVTLENRGSHWNPECVRCHVVGFQRFNDGRWGRMASGFRDPARTPFLGGVGCESCHGPG
ncbi:MAG: multiheme c-type cytochrome, partial [Planctomycetota bacterium]